MEDAQKPNRDYIEEWFPKSPDGELYKLQFHIEMESSGSTGEGATAQALLKYDVLSNAPPGNSVSLDMEQTIGTGLK